MQRNAVTATSREASPANALFALQCVYVQNSPLRVIQFNQRERGNMKGKNKDEGS